MTPLAALQAALTVEHQVVYGYGIVGAHLDARAFQPSGGVTRDECIERLDAHRALRDRLTTLVRGVGGRPVLSAPAYDVPFPVRSRLDAAQLGLVLENATAGAMWDLIEAAPGGSAARRLSVAELAVAARFAARWSGSAWATDTTALPGQPATAQPSSSATSSVSESTTPSGSTS
jgi:hypothetical protein